MSIYQYIDNSKTRSIEFDYKSDILMIKFHESIINNESINEFIELFNNYTGYNDLEIIDDYYPIRVRLFEDLTVDACYLLPIYKDVSREIDENGFVGVFLFMKDPNEEDPTIMQTLADGLKFGLKNKGLFSHEEFDETLEPKFEW